MCRQRQQLLVATLLSFIKRLPPKHQPVLQGQVRDIVAQHPDPAAAAKHLDYKLKFLQLAFPKVALEPPSQEPELEFELHQGQMRQVDDYGTHFHVREGQLRPGPAEPRAQTSFMNWFADNVDPEDMERHRKQLARMHYQGEQWPQGRPRSGLEIMEPVPTEVSAPELAPGAEVDNSFKPAKR
jgi:hypothetical protein